MSKLNKCYFRQQSFSTMSKASNSAWCYITIIVSAFIILPLFVQVYYILYNWNILEMNIVYKDRSIDTQHNVSICDINGSNTLFGAHHKTGTVLLTSVIRNMIYKYAHKKCIGYSPKDIITTSWGLSEYAINSFISNHDTEKYKIVIINMIRSPIDTILSGYNYHLNPPNHEMWLKTPLYEILDRANNILLFRKKRGKQVIDTPQTTLKCQSLIMLKLLNLSKINNTFNYTNLTIFNIYHKYNKSIGLDLEYQRYLTCEYNNIYDSYKKLKDLSIIQDKNIIGKNIKLEDFMATYKKYEIGLKNILETLGLNDKYDIYQLIHIFKHQRMHKNPKNDDHITIGKYDKETQINVLLSKIDRCYKLRNITIMLDYKWQYSEYCSI